MQAAAVAAVHALHPVAQAVHAVVPKYPAPQAEQVTDVVVPGVAIVQAIHPVTPVGSVADGAPAGVLEQATQVPDPAAVTSTKLVLVQAEKALTNRTAKSKIVHFMNLFL